MFPWPVEPALLARRISQFVYCLLVFETLGNHVKVLIAVLIKNFVFRRTMLKDEKAGAMFRRKRINLHEEVSTCKLNGK